MGTVYAEITLKNGDDVSDARRGRIKEQEVRQASVMAMVDTGAGTLVIDETTCQQLGLGIKGLRRSRLDERGCNGAPNLIMEVLSPSNHSTMNR
jgi:hypothetical protein